MNKFTYCVPTEIVFGQEAELQVVPMMRKRKLSRALIVYGGGSVVRSGLLARVEQALTDAGLAFAEFGGAHPNPSLSHAREGVKAAAKFGADLILAVGGGSVIDTAKGIAHGAANLNVDLWKFWRYEEPLTRSLPVGVILTISAAGSETSNSSVLTNDDTHEKRSIRTELNRPAFALLNPELTYTLPRNELAYGIADIMMHTIDRYFTNEVGNEFTDRVAEALLKNVMRFGKLAMSNHRDYQAMSELMWCGSVSHNGFTSLGRTMDFGVHKLGHEISGKYNVPHGASLTTMFGPWARCAMGDNVARFAQYATNVFDVNVGTDEERARAGIRLTEEYWRGLGLPLSFTELGIGVLDDAALDYLANMCTGFDKRPVGVFKKLDFKTARAIYALANK